MRCLERHIAIEVYPALLNAATERAVVRELRARGQAIGMPSSDLAGVPGSGSDDSRSTSAPTPS